LDPGLCLLANTLQVWTPEAEQSFRKLKDKLFNAPVLALPNSEKEFELYVDVKQGHAKGILVQEHGGTQRPVAYFSKLLDPVARGWPNCLQSCAATALMVTEARKLTAGGYLIVKVSHQVKALLTERAAKWMTGARYYSK
uniref:Reverse transcriptase/retrotransposon-derived protein RNase H-like domain-containing protein n=1 Tax=Malurus cyaneus samueli TaxID=2593467 RepID=A0A8C5UA32_9PASS